jgi:dynein heavy chain
MIAKVVNIEQPELEEKKDGLMREMAMNNKVLKECEDQILFELSNAGEGEAILKDDSVIIILQNAKTKSNEISIKNLEAEEINKEISEERLSYTTIAQRASILFFTIQEFRNIDPM